MKAPQWGRPAPVKQAPQPELFKVDQPSTAAAPLYHLTAHQCHWPLFDYWQSVEAALYCGCPVLTRPVWRNGQERIQASSYCPKHHKRSYYRWHNRGNY
jgi:hypothetical protein